MDGINKIWGEIKTGRGMFRALAGVTLSFAATIALMYFCFLVIYTFGAGVLLPAAALLVVAAAAIPFLISKSIDNFITKFIGGGLQYIGNPIVLTVPTYLIGIPAPILVLPLAPPRLNLA